MNSGIFNNKSLKVPGIVGTYFKTGLLINSLSYNVVGYHMIVTGRAIRQLSFQAGFLSTIRVTAYYRADTHFVVTTCHK